MSIWYLMALWSEHLQQTRKGWAGVNIGRDSSKASSSSSGLQLFYTLDTVALNPGTAGHGEPHGQGFLQEHGCRYLLQTRKTRDITQRPVPQVKGARCLLQISTCSQQEVLQELEVALHKVALTWDTGF